MEPRFRNSPSPVPGSSPTSNSIEEFRILTNNFDAEYGNYAGGQINVITKSGPTDYGGALEFLRNTDFDAKELLFRHPR